jgi:hypothetical protein
MATYPNLPEADGSIPVTVMNPGAAGSASTNMTLTQTTVSVPDTVMVAANSRRCYLAFLVVAAGAVCNVAFDTPAVEGVGMPFGSGSALGAGWTWDGDAPTNAIHIISTEATTIVVWEGVSNA